jgi:hypothetical protein
MTRGLLLRLGLALFAFAAVLLVEGNVGRIIQDGTVVQRAEAARRTVAVRRGGYSVRRTTVARGRHVAGVARRTTVRRGYTVRRTTVVRGPYAAGVARRTTRRAIRRTTIYAAALPRSCVRTTAYGYAVWRCGGVYYQAYGGRYVVVRF